MTVAQTAPTVAAVAPAAAKAAQVLGLVAQNTSILSMNLIPAFLPGPTYGRRSSPFSPVRHQNVSAAVVDAKMRWASDITPPFSRRSDGEGHQRAGVPLLWRSLTVDLQWDDHSENLEGLCELARCCSR